MKRIIGAALIAGAMATGATVVAADDASARPGTRCKAQTQWGGTTIIGYGGNQKTAVDDARRKAGKRGFKRGKLINVNCG